MFFAGTEPLHSGHYLGIWRKWSDSGDQQLIAADFVDIASFITVFNEWDTSEYLRRLVELNG
jgi:hypothetical protein